MRFNRDGMKDLNRNVLGTLQNSYRFFKMYADIDNWQHKGELKQPESTNILDQWMLARLNETIAEVTKQADDFKLAHAINPIFALIDDMSNWFIRRSRRRFWKSEDDTDKMQAYAVLHYTMARVCQLLAPWAPFLSDKLYRELMNGESVHLSDWPKAELANVKVLDDMKLVRDVINEGLRQRAQAKIKVRQPLSTVSFTRNESLDEQLLGIIREELNVKKVTSHKGDSDDVKLNLELTDELRAEGMMRDIVRHIQNLRKQSGLEVDDRIVLQIASQSELVNQAVNAHRGTIMHEVLAVSMPDVAQQHVSEVNIAGGKVTISISKTV
jgi:isoleucyl-tRNA synthetase